MSTDNILKFGLAAGAGYLGAKYLLPSIGYSSPSVDMMRQKMPLDVMGEASADVIRNRMNERQRYFSSFPHDPSMIGGNITNPNPLGMPEGIPSDPRIIGLAVIGILAVGAIVAFKLR